MSVSYDEMMTAVAAKREELLCEVPPLSPGIIQPLSVLLGTPRLPCEIEDEQRLLQWHRDQGHEVRGNQVLRPYTKK